MCGGGGADVMPKGHTRLYLYLLYHSQNRQPRTHARIHVNWLHTNYTGACLEDPVNPLNVEPPELVDVDHIAVQQDKTIPHRLRQGVGVGVGEVR